MKTKVLIIKHDTKAATELRQQLAKNKDICVVKEKACQLAWCSYACIICGLPCIHLHKINIAYKAVYVIYEL